MVVVVFYLSLTLNITNQLLHLQTKGDVIYTFTALTDTVGIITIDFKIGFKLQNKTKQRKLTRN